MKAFVVVALALAAVCLADVPVIENEGVTHVVIPKGAKGVVYRWPQSKSGLVYAEGCFGVIKLYQKSTNDINPVTDKIYTIFNETAPVHKMTFLPGYYIGFFVDEANDDGPDSINGAMYIAAATTEEKRNKLLPSTMNEYVEINIAMNSHKATLTWQSTGEDNTTVYRKDISLKTYDKQKDFPPERYYQTACSAQLWLKYDEDATKGVKFQNPGSQITAFTQVHDITEKDVTIVAIVTEFKNAELPFPRAYKFVALGAASTTVLSTLAFVLLLVSVLLI